MKERFRFYRVHKLVIPLVNDITRLIAKTNFCDISQVKALQIQLEQLITILIDHGNHEDRAFHSLLEAKDSMVHESIASDHKAHYETFADLRDSLSVILEETDVEQQKQLGYQFYLKFRQFEAHMLIHLNFEESVIMPALQRLYTDEELQAVEARTYQHKDMTPAAMVGMLSMLFPYMDVHDRFAFLESIHHSAPDKFAVAFGELLASCTCFDDGEVARLQSHFSTQ